MCVCIKRERGERENIMKYIGLHRTFDLHGSQKSSLTIVNVATIEGEMGQI